MDRYSVEKRDREVVEKFRAVVESGERRKKRNRIRIAGGLLIIVCAGLIIFYNHFSPSSGGPPSVSHQSNKIAVNRKTHEKQTSSQEEVVLSDQSKFVESISGLPDKDASKPATDNLAKPDGTAGHLTASAEGTESSVVPVLRPRVKSSAKAGIAEIPEPVSADTGIRIAEMVTCQGVQNRQPVSRKNMFSIKEGAKPYVWMDVRSEKTPYTLRHVYYLNDRRYCVVPLEIRYPRMRTWSTVSLRYLTQTGKWRVDVETQQGAVLSRAEFSVIP